MLKHWYVYILSCADASYYTGITTDVPSRVDSHNSGKGRVHSLLPVFLFKGYGHEKVECYLCSGRDDAVYIWL